MRRLPNNWIQNLVACCCCILLWLGGAAQEQDTLATRLILIGDAGEINAAQAAVVQHALGKVLAGRTTAIYLGDNIYPRGMFSHNGSDSGSAAILRHQFGPLRQAGVPVIFIPGNHDWDRSGNQGLEHIRLANQYFNSLRDSGILWLPQNGCPGPVSISLSDEAVLIILDTEWWLHPFNKPGATSDCECQTEAAVIARLRELLYYHADKQVFIATHHPFQTHGAHGGYFTWKDHLFPLTAINKSLYLPLPVIGSIYPLGRKSFGHLQDVAHPQYRHLINSITPVLGRHTNLIQVSGHEHSLQLLEGDITQVVSGAGAKQSPVKQKGNSRFASPGEGYAIADISKKGDATVRFYVLNAEGNEMEERYVWHKAKEPVPSPVILATKQQLVPDSITTTALAAYDSVNGFHRFMLGKNYRHIWALPATLPYLKLSKEKGGLRPLQLGGGFQTKSLRMEDSQGREWVMRSIEKFPESALPEGLRTPFAVDIVKDQISAAHPYAPLLVPVLAAATGVPHANPVIGIVAPDTALGPYGPIFEGSMVLLEEREPMGKSVSTPKMLKAMREDNDNHVDAPAFLKARLLDAFIGDWDRHEDQWRWHEKKKGNGSLFTAVPRDRDQALFVNEGLISRIAAAPWIMPHLQGWTGKYRNINGLMVKGGRLLDPLVLGTLERKVWDSITHNFVGSLNDTVLQMSLLQLPAPVAASEEATLMPLLQQRRDALTAASDHYFRFLNKVVDVFGSDKNEVITITDGPQKMLRVKVVKRAKSGDLEDVLFDNLIDPRITKEIRIFTLQGSDSTHVNTRNNGIKIRIVGGKDPDLYQITEGGKRVVVYDDTRNVAFEGKQPRRTILKDASWNLQPGVSNRYHRTMPMIAAGYNLDDGVLLGAGIKHIHQGFRKTPFASQQSLMLQHSLSTDAWRVNYRGEWHQLIGRTGLRVDLDMRAPDNTTNFFGVGNDTRFIDVGKQPIRFYRIRYNWTQLHPHFTWDKGNSGQVFAGPSFQYYTLDSVENRGRLIRFPALVGSYDSSSVSETRFQGGVTIGYSFEKKDRPLLPGRGMFAHVQLQSYVGLNKASESYSRFFGDIGFYLNLNARRTIVLANRTGGGYTWGKAAFYQMMYMGGQGNLLGWRQFRFAGQHMIYNNLELRTSIARFTSYLLPGELGLVGFWDLGRVWAEGQTSRTLHHGVGAGLYLVPARLTVLQVVAGYSREGWLPYFSLGFRF